MPKEPRPREVHGMPRRKTRPDGTGESVSARRHAAARSWTAAGLVAVATVLASGCRQHDAGKATLHEVAAELPPGNQRQATATTVPAVTSHGLAGTTVAAPASVRVTGSLFPDEKCQVAANASGIVREVLVDRGSMVKSGDVLARLDARDAQNALAEGIAFAEETRVKLGLKPGCQEFSATHKPEVQHAKAVLELAEKNYRRDAELLARQVISQQDADKSQNEYTLALHSYEQAVTEAERLHQSYLTAQVHLRTLAKAVEDTTITAPFDGLISARHVAPGERLSSMGAGGTGSGSCVASLVRIDPLRLRLTVSEQDLSKTSGRPRDPLQCGCISRAHLRRHRRAAVSRGRPRDAFACRGVCGSERRGWRSGRECSRQRQYRSSRKGRGENPGGRRPQRNGARSGLPVTRVAPRAHWRTQPARPRVCHGPEGRPRLRSIGQSQAPSGGDRRCRSLQKYASAGRSSHRSSS